MQQLTHPSNMPVVEPWAKIIEYWRLSGIPIRPGVQPSQVAEFQSKYGVTIPRDVLEYLETVDGSSFDFTDSDCYRFWPLSEIRPVHEVLDDSTGVIYPDRFSYPDCFAFSDYLMNSWLYAVRFTGEPLQPAHVYRVAEDATPGEPMALPFREFMVSYAANPKSIL